MRLRGPVNANACTLYIERITSTAAKEALLQYVNRLWLKINDPCTPIFHKLYIVFHDHITIYTVTRSTFDMADEQMTWLVQTGQSSLAQKSHYYTQETTRFVIRLSETHH